MENFLSYIEQEKRYSEHTLKSYRNDLEQFFNEVNVDTHLSKRDARAYLVWLLEQDYSIKTVHRKISSIRSYYDYLCKKEGYEANPFANLQLPKISRKLPVVPQKGELAALFDYFEREEQDFEILRARLIFDFLYSCGLRVSELMELKWKNYSDTEIKVLGKGKKERLIPVNSKLNLSVKLYKNALSQEFTTHFDDHILVTNKGQKLYYSFVYSTINRYIVKASMVNKCSPHKLRHAFATHLLDGGAQLSSVKELLGHESLATTEIYTHNSLKKIKGMYNQSHPRGRDKKS